jgi:capsular polysaccharide biosynthesis protein
MIDAAMTQPTAPPPPILNYDPHASAHFAKQWRRRVIIALLGGTLGAQLGFFIRPNTYTASGVLSVAPPGIGPAAQSGRPALSLNAHAAAVVSPTNLSAASQAAGMQGVTITPQELSQDVRVQVIGSGQTQAILVSYAGPNPAASAAVVNTLIRNYVVASGYAVSVATAPAPPPPDAPQPFWIAAGFVVGLACGYFIGIFRWRGRESVTLP